MFAGNWLKHVYKRLKADILFDEANFGQFCPLFDFP